MQHDRRHGDVTIEANDDNEATIRGARQHERTLQLPPQMDSYIYVINTTKPLSGLKAMLDEKMYSIGSSEPSSADLAHAGGMHGCCLAQRSTHLFSPISGV